MLPLDLEVRAMNRYSTFPEDPALLEILYPIVSCHNHDTSQQWCSQCILQHRYKTLRADCMEKGWICHVIPTEVGCRSFLGHSVISFFSKTGITGCSLKVASYRLQTMAQSASTWILSKAKSFQHEWNTRRTTIPMWLRKKRSL